MCVELAHVFPSMGSRRLVTMLTYLAPLMVQSEKQALLPCSLYAFFLILLFSNADFRSSAVFHFFYTATRLLYASTPFLLSFCLSVSLGQTTFCSKLYSTLRCTHSKQPLPASNILRMHIALIKKRQMGLLM